MAELTQIDQAGAAAGDTFNGMTVKHVIADGKYIFGQGQPQSSQDIAIAANTAALEDAVNATQAELDAALAGGATDAEVEAIRAQLQSDVDALNASQATQDTGIAGKADQAALDAETARATAAEALKADQAALDAEIARATAAEATKEPLLPADTALRYLQRNAANDGWQLVDIPISSANLVSGPGVPAAGVGEDGFYYQQLDAAVGANDLWGPKAAGAWPAQADFRSADPEVGTITDVGDAVEGVRPKSWSADNLKLIGDTLTNGFFRSIRADFDYSAITTNDIVGIYNPEPNGLNITLAAAAVTCRVSTLYRQGVTTVDQDSFTLRPNECCTLSRQIDGTIDILFITQLEQSKMRASAEALTYGENIVFQDDTVGAAPALPQLGLYATYSIGTIQANRGNFDGSQEIVWQHFVTAEDGGAINWAASQAQAGETSNAYPATGQPTTVNTVYAFTIPTGVEAAITGTAQVTDGQAWSFLTDGGAAIDSTDAAAVAAAIDGAHLTPLGPDAPQRDRFMSVFQAGVDFDLLAELDPGVRHFIWSDTDDTGDYVIQHDGSINEVRHKGQVVAFTEVSPGVHQATINTRGVFALLSSGGTFLTLVDWAAGESAPDPVDYVDGETGAVGQLRTLVVPDGYAAGVIAPDAPVAQDGDSIAVKVNADPAVAITDASTFSNALGSNDITFIGDTTSVTSKAPQFVRPVNNPVFNQDSYSEGERQRYVIGADSTGRTIEAIGSNAIFINWSNYDAVETIANPMPVEAGTTVEVWWENNATYMQVVERLSGIESNAVYGSYKFTSSGENGFSWVEAEARNTTGSIANNGAAGLVLSGGIYRVSYTAQKQTNGGAARVGYYVDGAAQTTLLGTTSNAGAAYTDIVDASATDKTIRHVRLAASGQGNTDAQLVIEKIRYNINYVEKDSVLEVEDTDTVLIDVDATNGTNYTFATGETWAQIKQNYDRLIVTGNASRSGTNQIRPWSFIMDLGSMTDAFGQAGYRIDFTNDYSVTIYADVPSDAATGLTYRQSGGDTPTSGRMQFKVVGVKSSRTVIQPGQVAVTNPNDAGVLTSNEDGTATFQAGAQGDAITVPYRWTSLATNTLQPRTLTGSAAIKAQGYVFAGYQVHVVSGTGRLSTTEVGIANNQYITNTAFTNVDTTDDIRANFYAIGSSTQSKTIEMLVRYEKAMTVVNI